MDNQAYYGFRLFRGAGFGSAIGTPQVLRVPVASNYDSTTPTGGTAGVGFTVGDVVSQKSDGTVQHCVVDATPTPGENSAALGVVVGIEPWFDSSIGQAGALRRTPTLPAGVIYGTNLERQSNLLIVSMAGNVFEVDVNDNTTATTQAAYTAFIGEQVTLVYNAVAPKAFPRINISTHTVGTGTQGQFRILGISPNFANQDFSGLNVKLLVTGNIVQDAPFQVIGV